jgi:hypothetical protein
MTITLDLKNLKVKTIALTTLNLHLIDKAPEKEKGSYTLGKTSLMEWPLYSTPTTSP